MNASATNAKVLAQYERFVAAVPDLMKRHAGRWAVWLDGLKGTFETEDEAFAWADANVPPHSGVVVARVEPQEPALLSAAWAFMPRE